MKKYLLTALLGVFGLCTAFASAESFNFVGTLQGSDGVYNPSSITFDNDITITPDNVNYVCDVNDDVYSCRLMFGYNCTIDWFGGDFAISSTYGDYCLLTAGTYDVRGSGNPFSSFTINSSSSEGGSSEGSSSLISGGTTAFSGIINSLGSAVSEFIPYVAYIGIGLLSAIIGFVAIKRLINRVRAKIFGTFNSRRKR